MIANEPYTVLVVDDDRDLRVLIEKMLHRLGCQTAIAGSGAEAMAWLEGNNADLMLLDYRLPDMTGRAVVEALSRRECEIPFILVTGQGDESLAAEMLKGGAQDYLKKDSQLLDRLEPAVTETFRRLEQEARLRRAEQALRQSEAQYRGVFNAAGEGLLILDGTGMILDANPRACTLYGYSQEELVQRSIRELIHEDSERQTSVFLETTVREGRFHGESVHVRKDKSVFDVEIRGTEFEFGGRAHFLAIVCDITERKWAQEELRLTHEQVRLSEQAIRERESRLRAIFQGAAVGIALIDRGGRPIESNQELQHMLGYNKHELRNLLFTELIDAEQRSRCLDQFRSLINGVCKSVQSEHRCVRKDGKVFWVRSHSSAVDSEKGSPDYVIMLLEDITERMYLEEELRMFTAEIEQNNRELGQFAYFASHDLYQPLKNIMGFCEQLKDSCYTSLNGQDREYLDYIETNARRMDQLINDLLTYSRLETRGKPFKEVDLSVVAECVLNNRAQQIKQAGARVDVDDLPKVMGDPDQLEQLLGHLIDNALKFRSKDRDPVIHVSLNPQEERIEVQDNGIGVAPQYHDRIFYMFQKLHSKDDYPGTGIGLSISKKIVERHGGRIGVQSEPEKGSLFFFTLGAGQLDGAKA